MTECPLCGGIVGYARKETYEYERQVDWDDEQEYGGSCEYIDRAFTAKRWYCCECRGNVTRHVKHLHE